MLQCPFHLSIPDKKNFLFSFPPSSVPLSHDSPPAQLSAKPPSPPLRSGPADVRSGAQSCANSTTEGGKRIFNTKDQNHGSERSANHGQTRYSISGHSQMVSPAS